MITGKGIKRNITFIGAVVECNRIGRIEYENIFTIYIDSLINVPQV